MSLAFEASQAIPFRLETSVDNKAWAKRLLWREERGDTTVTPIQVRFAREALDKRTEEKG